MTIETPKQRLTELRQRIVENQAAQTALRNSPAAPEERRQAVIDAVDRQARAFAETRFDILAYARHAKDVPIDRILPETRDCPGGFKNYREMMCYFFGDVLKAKVLAKLDAAEIGPPLEEAERRSAALVTELLELERAEEGLIRELEADGYEIDRRADADPAVVLDPRLCGTEATGVDQAP